MDQHDHHGSHHHHGVGHQHHPTPGRSNSSAFVIGAAINTAFVVLEFGYGFTANSVALMADAVHNLGDVLSLLVAWGAAWLTSRPPSGRRTYGWGRSSILAALFNAAVLLVGVGAIGVEAIQRLITPEPVVATTVIWVALLGIAVNGGSAVLFMRGRGSDLNIRAQFLHLAGDTVVSAGVVIAALLIRWSGLVWLDPVASLLVAVAITMSTWGVLREAIDLSLDAVPEQVAHKDVMDWLSAMPGVTEVHDLHIWGLSTTETALTAHLVCTDARSPRRLHDLMAELRQRFGIGHATLQIESDADAALCHLRPHDVI